MIADAQAQRRETTRAYTAVGRNVGFCRAFDPCSNVYAYVINAGSLHAPPKKEMPDGKSEREPRGNVMCGYPATADADE
jgi:hypothetical protein